MDGILVASTLGLLGGSLMVVAGRDIIEATKSGTYETVIGLTVITGLVATIGLVVCIISVLGIAWGVWRVVRYNR